jgi:DNA-directed RNA polymerase alpha subunit
MKIEDIHIPRPAYRALKNAGIMTLEQVASYREEDLLELHGFGQKALGILTEVMKEKGLTYRQ